MPRRLRKILTRLAITAVIIYCGICMAVYFFQEKLLFIPQKLPAAFVFKSENNFTEETIPSKTGNKLNCLFFPADASKGLIVYLHGNGGSLERWSGVASDFLPLHYDLLIYDYAGYGKSTGDFSEENLFLDAQAVYDFAKQKTSEDRIVIYGRSLGTGIGAHLASQNNPEKLILEAPYYSMVDLSKHLYPFLPSFLLRYPLRTDLFIQHVRCPVTIFHGTEDEIIYTASSEKLRTLFKPGDQLIEIAGGHHNDLKHFAAYRQAISSILQ